MNANDTSRPIGHHARQKTSAAAREAAHHKANIFAPTASKNVSLLWESTPRAKFNLGFYDIREKTRPYNNHACMRVSPRPERILIFDIEVSPAMQLAPHFQSIHRICDTFASLSLTHAFIASLSWCVCLRIYMHADMHKSHPGCSTATRAFKAVAATMNPARDSNMHTKGTGL